MLWLDERRGIRLSIRVALVVGMVIVALVVARQLGLFRLSDRAELAAAIDRMRRVPFAAAIFVVTYAIAAAVGVPATPLTFGGGALFGVGRGIVLNWLGAMLASLLAFGMARATGLRAKRRGAPADGAATGLVSSQQAFLTLVRLRLIPVVPFALLNAGAAVSGMSWRAFALATAVGIVPIVVIYTTAASELVAGVTGTGRHAFLTALASGSVLVALSFLPSLVSRRRKGNPVSRAG